MQAAIEELEVFDIRVKVRTHGGPKFQIHYKQKDRARPLAQTHGAHLNLEEVAVFAVLRVEPELGTFLFLLLLVARLEGEAYARFVRFEKDARCTREGIQKRSKHSIAG